MNVRFAEHDDLDAIEEVTRWACSEAIGEMVPEDVVDVLRPWLSRLTMT